MTGHDRHHISRGVCYGLATTVVGATAAVTVKWLNGQGLSPWFIVWVQYGIGVLVLVPWLLRLGPATALRTSRLRIHTIRSLGGWVGFCAFYLALPSVPLVDATVLRYAAPLWVPVVVWLWWRSRIPMPRALALLGGFVGVLVMLRPDMAGINAGHLLGVLAGLGLAVSMAATRALSSSEPANRVLCYYFGIAFLASTPMALPHLQPLTLATTMGLLYVGLSIFLTMVLYTRAFSYAPTTVVAPLSYVGVPVAGLLDWWLWGHLPQAAAVYGILIIIFCGVLAVTSGHRQPSEH